MVYTPSKLFSMACNDSLCADDFAHQSHLAEHVSTPRPLIPSGTTLQESPSLSRSAASTVAQFSSGELKHGQGRRAGRLERPKGEKEKVVEKGIWPVLSGM